MASGTTDHAPTEIDCAWCGDFFANIVDLLFHVEADHLPEDGVTA